MTSRLLQIFAKAPVRGEVKTRLAADIGEQQACEVYNRLLNNTIENSCSEDWDVELWCAPDINHSVFRSLAKQFGLMLKAQHGEALGERMLYTLGEGKKAADKVVLIGTDCPVISLEYIEQAFEALNTNDIVFGPVEDGGYILVGVREINQNMFSDVEWSVADTLEQNIKAIEHCNLSYGLLPKLWDLDGADDLKRWQQLR
ncbi:MAG TPA: glycosyltransferase [Cycloclasticus sp.]|jgi:rSAM/selenodomain-associated transferase 1|nr:glycosyltransferase [Cycloclasticus sp.]HIL91782.1 glycosyltransferase [Cycloclasticus sp.]